MTELVTVTDVNRVRTIRMNRPDKKNAITRPMYSAMADALAAANADDVRVVIIAGAPGAFSAGNDLVDFMEAPPHIGGEDAPPVENFMRALLACEKPVIGTTLLLHCDLAYATPRSVFTTPFVNLALAPEFGSSQVLPGIVGRAVASELLMLGATWDAARAEAKSLINAVLPEKGFDGAVHAVAEELAAKAPAAVKAAKALIIRPKEELSARIVHEGGVFAGQLRSDEFREAATAFMERRAPDFSKFG